MIAEPVDWVRLEARAGLAASIAALIADGIEGGEFLDQDAVFVARRLSARCWGAGVLEGVVATLASRDKHQIDRGGIAV